MLLPVGVGAVLTLVLLTKAVDWLLNNHYSVTFHGIIGVVIAATIFTIPVAAFTASVSSCLIHLLFVVLGVYAQFLHLLRGQKTILRRVVTRTKQVM